MSELLVYIIIMVISLLLTVGYNALTADASKHALHYKARGLSRLLPVVVFASIIGAVVSLELRAEVMMQGFLVLFLLSLIAQLLLFPLALLSQATRQKIANKFATRNGKIGIAFVVLVGKVIFILAAHTLRLVLRIFRRGLAAGGKSDSYDSKSPFEQHGQLSSSEKSRKNMGLPY